MSPRFVRRGSSLPELTAKAMQAREKRKRGEEGGVGQKAGKKLMARRRRNKDLDQAQDPLG